MTRKSRKKTNCKQPETKEPPMPPIATMPQVVMGPAKRHIRVEHGQQVVVNKIENGAFWFCSECKTRCEVWGQKAHNHVATGKQLPVKCPVCSKWVIGSKNHIEVVSDGQATVLMRQMLNTRRY